MDKPLKRSLPRLPKTSYQGFASVFWTHCIRNRETGWLDECFHLKFRELLCHQLHRYSATCPVYCLMPDHLHFLISGVGKAANQLNLTKNFRRAFQHLIRPFQLQSQAHDHVLRREKQDRDAFQSIAYYILENPVRKKICSNWQDYPFSGCLVPGYFELDPTQENFWEIYWRIYNKLVDL